MKNSFSNVQIFKGVTLASLVLVCVLGITRPASAAPNCSPDGVNYGNPIVGSVTLSQASNVTITYTGGCTGPSEVFGYYTSASATKNNLGTGRGIWGASGTTAPGTSFQIGNFPAGTEIILFIYGDGSNPTLGAPIFSSGPAFRNTDGALHAHVESPSANVWNLYFEDSSATNNRDYNDINFTVTAVPSSVTPACSTNAQCGTNTPTGSLFCQSGNVYQNVTTYTCNNPGAANSSCTNAPVETLQTTCNSNQTCSSGVCVNNSTGVCSTNSQCGTNGLTGSPTCNGNSIYQNYRTWTCNNPATASSSCSFADSNQFQSNCLSNQTCSNGTCSNVSTGACSTNAQCGTPAFTGSPFCQGNSVYQSFNTYICVNPGTPSSSCFTSTNPQFQSTCAFGQTCSGNGICGTTITNTCTQNASQRCVGNSVYWFDSCGVQGSVASICSGNQTCQFNTCVTTQNTCVSNSYQQCVGNSLYWYNSCGVQQGLSQTCLNNQTCSGNACVLINNNVCTQNASQRCVGSAVYWFDSCGVQGSLAQVCSGNQICSGNICQNQTTNIQGSLLVTELVRNLSSGNLTWATTVNASPSDVLQFQITVSTSGNQTVNNVTITDTFPANLAYNDNLTLDGVSNPGNIQFGLNIGSVLPGQTRIVTYQAQVAGASSFPLGTTTFNNSVRAASTDPNNIPTTANAAISVTQGGVLGASTVSTGLTNNPFLDSFFIPLLIALAGIWLWRSGVMPIPSWVGGAQLKNKETAAQKQLQDKIAEIRGKELA